MHICSQGYADDVKMATDSHANSHFIRRRAVTCECASEQLDCHILLEALRWSPVAFVDDARSAFAKDVFDLDIRPTDFLEFFIGRQRRSLACRARVAREGEESQLRHVEEPARQTLESDR